MHAPNTVERYRKVHALMEGATTDGERQAAQGVLSKLQARYPGIHAQAYPPRRERPWRASRRPEAPYAGPYTSGIVDPGGEQHHQGWWDRLRDVVESFSGAQELLDEALIVNAKITRQGGLRAVLRVEPEDVDELLSTIVHGGLDPDAVAQTAADLLFAKVSKLLENEVP